LNVNIYVLFYGDSSHAFALIAKQMKFGTVNDHGHTFICTIILFGKVFKYGDCVKC
jgi:hypothetical protein